MSLHSTPPPRRIRILIINPNTSQSMTEGLRPAIESLAYNDTTYTYHTAPSGVFSINSPADALLSTTHNLPSLLPLLAQHDAFLVACFSPHPLVAALKGQTAKPVVGIFEASIASAVQLLTYPSPPPAGAGKRDDDDAGSGKLARFGIVTTGVIWKHALESAIRSPGPEMLGPERVDVLLAGVEAVGMDAGDLHGSEQVEELVRKAVGALGEVGVVILGCAGMVGMNRWVREELDRRGKGGKVVDGVKAGVGILQGLVRVGW